MGAFLWKCGRQRFKKKISYEELVLWLIKNNYGWLTVEEMNAILCIITPNWGQPEEEE